MAGTTVQLREVLEKLLDDDSDMKDLNLSAKVGPAARMGQVRLSDA